MQGIKTVIIGLILAIVPAATQYLGVVDWAHVLPAPWGMVVSGVIMVVLRLVTTTPVFQKSA